MTKLSKPHGIILLGANGSGKSTLGRELARALNFAHFDVEDYWFNKADIPYTAIRPQKERNEMLLSDMKKHGSFVVSGNISGWSDEFLTMFDLAVFLTAPAEVRMKRIENREYARWGNRVCKGGDMYESQQKFREFAATRDVGLLEQSALKYSCPVLRVDGTQELHETIRLITRRLCTRPETDITIRIAVDKDAAALNRLNTVFNGVGNVTDEFIALSVRNNDQERVFVAECDEQLVGFCCVQLFKSFCYSSNYAEITELFVDEQHRRKGIASRLMEYTESYYSDKNIGGFQLFTGRVNISAQRFYEHIGYSKTDEIMYRKRK